MRLFLGPNSSNLCFLVTNKETFIIDKNNNEILGKKFTTSILDVLLELGLNYSLYKSIVFNVKVLAAIVQQDCSSVMIAEQDLRDIKVLGLHTRDKWIHLKNAFYSDTLLVLKYKLINMRKDWVHLNQDYVEYVILLKR